MEQDLRPKRLRFPSLDKQGKRNKNPKGNNYKIVHFQNVKIAPETVPKKCSVCSVDISHKKAISKYCSKKCNNKLNGQKRTMRNQGKRKKEIDQLKKLGNTPKIRNPIMIEIRDNGICEAVSLYQNEINCPYPWIRKVVKATIPARVPVVLTSHRAKKLIQIISNLNSKKDET